MRVLAAFGAALFLVAALLISQTNGTRPSQPSNRALEDQLWEHRNLGKAFYENPTTQTQAVDEFKKALDLQPNSVREQLNYALALLRAAKSKEGVAVLERVQKLDSSLPHTWFNLGIVFKKDGEFDRAQTQFEQMIKLAPQEPIAHYNLGALYKQNGRAEEATREFQIAERLNANLAAPHFQLFNMYRLAGKSTEAATELQAFQQIKKAQEGAAIPEDMEWCDYAEIYDPVSALPASPPATPQYTETRLPATVEGPGNPGYAVIDGELIVWTPRRIISKRPGLEALHNVRAIAPGDFDNDGRMDLAAVLDTSVQLCRNEGAKFTCSNLLSGNFNGATFLDYDHDYDLDLFLFGTQSKLMRNQGTAGFADRTADFPFVAKPALHGDAVRINPDSKGFDLRVAQADGSVTVYRDLLNGKYAADAAARAAPEHALGRNAVFGSDGTITERVPRLPTKWIRVRLEGVKNLKLAQGAYVEIKAGALYLRERYDGEPLLFDLRLAKEVDTVRITWPNGLIQNEVHQATNKEYVYKEAQRLSGSCPMIWTWNGKEFQFITDVLGIAPLGASSGDGSYFPVDHDEYVQIPASAFAEKDGALELRLSEELSEVSFIDQLELYSIDHPSAEEVFVNEKWKGPPFPVFRFYGAKGRIHPKAALDSNGKDVTAALLHTDHKYPNQFPRAESGIADLHSLTLDFTGAAAGNKAVLILNGWVDWADGSTFMAAAQESKAGLIPPYLQVRNAKGEWQTVIDDMGMPDGKPKTITVDLTGRFLTADRHLRIVTNLCVYWDEISLSETSSAPTLRQTPLPVLSAQLAFRGFSASKIDPERKQPESFFYSQTTPRSFWNPTPGNYTRYGDIRELMAAPDDRYAIVASGDEIRMRFGTASLPAIAAGFRREYLLKVDGWAKDRDANTAFSQTVEPLPFHGMSSYPYPAAEHYPNDPKHRDYRLTYNTRPALRLIRPLNR